MTLMKWTALLLLSAALPAAAATVTARVYCNLGPFITTTSLATPVSCAAGITSASAVVQVNNVSAQGYGSFENPSGGFAQFDQDYILTFFGGTGTAYWSPTINMTYSGDVDQSAFASAVFGPFSRSVSTTGGFPLSPLAVPFVFGTPFAIHLRLIASASDGGRFVDSTAAAAALTGINTYSEPLGPPLFGTSFTLVEAPEPSYSLLLAGLGMILWMIRSGRHRSLSAAAFAASSVCPVSHRSPSPSLVSR